MALSSSTETGVVDEEANMGVVKEVEAGVVDTTAAIGDDAPTTGAVK